jgi:hypothetical protein
MGATFDDDDLWKADDLWLEEALSKLPEAQQQEIHDAILGQERIRREFELASPASGTSASGAMSRMSEPMAVSCPKSSFSDRLCGSTRSTKR